MLDLSDACRILTATFLTGACQVQPLAAVQDSATMDYPNRPIRFVAPALPGGSIDTIARATAQKLSEAWGRQVIVDNRAGAAGAIAVDLTAKAAPDGYTICVISAQQTVNSAVNSKLSYDLTKDIAPISRIASTFYVLFQNPSVPVKSVKELIAYAKAHPGKLNYGSASTGSLQHLAGEMLGYMTGVKFVHVSYKGGPAVITAILTGEVQIGFTSLTPIQPHLSTGRLRALAITSNKRSSVLPELPTVAEAGVIGYELDQWYGVITGVKVPSAIIMKLNGGLAEALRSPEIVQRLVANGSNPVGSSPSELGVHIKSDISKWRKLVTDARLVLN